MKSVYVSLKNSWSNIWLGIDLRRRDRHVGLIWYILPSRYGQWNIPWYQGLWGHNLFFSSLIMFNYYTEHNNVNAVLCTKFQNVYDYVLYYSRKDFALIELKLNFRWINYISVALVAIPST